MNVFEVIDPRFKRCIKASARLDHLYAGCRWAEGPAYFPAHRQLVWSDVPNDRMLRYDETSGQTSVFRAPSNYANGNTVDRQGRLLTCEQGARRITRTEHDGSLTVLADRYAGKRLNSPNDIVVAPDGGIYFSDPPYGIDSDYEGNKGEPEYGGSFVFRIDPVSGALAKVADDFDRPNGLAFSPDGRRLYISDTGAPRHVRVFDVDADGSLAGGDVFATMAVGAYDGFRLDDAGRIWTSAGDGVYCYAPDGTLLGKILAPEPVANVAWGWPKRNRLYLAASSSLYAVLLTVNGARTV